MKMNLSTKQTYALLGSIFIVVIIAVVTFSTDEASDKSLQNIAVEIPAASAIHNSNAISFNTLSSNTVWNLVDQEPKVKTIPKKIVKKRTVQIKDNLIEIEKNQYFFYGFIESGGEKKLLFLNTDKRNESSKFYRLGESDFIEDKLKIKKFNQYEIIFEDVNVSEELILNLHYVNQEDFKPKK
jgi:hypothetical protein